HEVAEVGDDAPVLLSRHTADTGRRALADIAQEARSADMAGAFEDARGTRARGKDTQQQIEGLADRPGVRVRPEIAHAFAFGAPHHLESRKLLVERHREIRIAFVVAVSDVEARVVLLDPGVFELERLDFGVDRHPVHRGGGGEHLLRARMQLHKIAEVGVETATQILGLADVNDPTVGVAKAINPWGFGDRAGRGTVGGRIGHYGKPSSPASGQTDPVRGAPPLSERGPFEPGPPERGLPRPRPPEHEICQRRAPARRSRGRRSPGSARSPWPSHATTGLAGQSPTVDLTRRASPAGEAASGEHDVLALDLDLLLRER